MLANKYRPNEFEAVVGQDVTIKILNKLKDNLPTALLFVGPAGCGKTTCARILAKDKETYEIDCASNNGVSEIKNIIDNAKRASLVNKHRVFILDEAHTLTSAAWASLLITLEEDISYVTFIFCTTDAHKIPDTILSRVMQFNFLALSEEQIFSRLIKVADDEGINAEQTALRFLARISSGNMRAALASLDKCILYDNAITLASAQKILNIVDKSTILDLFATMRSNRVLAVTKIKDIQNNGYNLYTMLETALRYFVQDCERRCAVKEIDFILETMNSLRYMIANPGNVCNYLCAKVLVYDWTK